jgi:hypothetical protein
VHCSQSASFWLLFLGDQPTADSISYTEGNIWCVWFLIEFSTKHCQTVKLNRYQHRLPVSHMIPVFF